MKVTLSSFKRAFTKLDFPTVGLPITPILILLSSSSYPGSYPSVTIFNKSFTPVPCSAEIGIY